MDNKRIPILVMCLERERDNILWKILILQIIENFLKRDRNVPSTKKMAQAYTISQKYSKR